MPPSAVATRLGVRSADCELAALNLALEPASYCQFDFYAADALGLNVMPHGQDNLYSNYFHSVQFVLRPLFCEEIVTQYDYAKPTMREVPVDGCPEAITDL